LSLGTEEAQALSGSRPGRRPLAVTVLVVSAAVLTLGGLSPADVSKYPNLVSISQASAALAQDLRAFLSWAISTGRAQLAQVNFQPLPPSVVMLSLAQIAKIKG
jgi:hypothetical protein